MPSGHHKTRKTVPPRDTVCGVELGGLALYWAGEGSVLTPMT